MVNDELKIFRESVTGTDHKISDNIIVKNRTLGDICDFGESEYYNLTSLLCALPAQHKVWLWDSGVDWTTITNWEFLLYTYKQLKELEVEFVLDIKNFKTLELYENSQNGEYVFGYTKKYYKCNDCGLNFTNDDCEIYDVCSNCNGTNIVLEGEEPKVVIDKMFWFETCDYMRKANGFTQEEYEPLNEYSKKKMVNKDRKRIARQQERSESEKNKSMLLPLIASLVNHQSFKYNYEDVWNITIGALTESTHRIQKFVNYMQVMGGVYAGNVSYDKLNKDELNWLN